MGKTRSQTLNTTIKKEEEDCKPSLCLYSANNTTTNKITKRNPSRPLSAQQVKVEEDTDTKSLLKPTFNHSKSGKMQTISQEQINQLIHYIVNDNMSASAAARKVNISQASAFIYYTVYKNDPEKRIPVPRNQRTHPRKYYTQEQIGNLIKHINDGKMTIKEASVKADMPYSSACQYYNRYLEDPNHNIPVPSRKHIYTQEQREAFLGYIINNKMSVKAASRKAKMNFNGAKNYFHNYFNVQNPGIARPSHIVTPKHYTQEQIKEVIGYIVDDKMSIAAASRKVNVDHQSARRHYRQYLKGNSMEISVSNYGRRYTQDQINELIRYIVDDKMTIRAASIKANINRSSCYLYYHKYINDHNLGTPISKSITQYQINQPASYIVHDKMSVKAAWKKKKEN
jgi:molybdenum-dependent DNA-binding transcriptional regulator ModE